MSDDFQVLFNIEDFNRGFHDLERQIPFATSVALNETVKDVQAELRRELPTKFTVRTGWVAKGIRVKRSSKRDLVAEVGSKDAFMRRQEEGGDKTTGAAPRSGEVPGPAGELFAGAGAVAIPVNARSNPTQTLSRRRWPAALLRRGTRYFAKALKSGDVGVFRRMGRGGRHLRLMWVVTDHVDVPPRWGFEETFERVVRKQWPKRARAAWEKAFTTRR